VSSAPGVSSRLLSEGVVAALLLRQSILGQGLVSAAAVGKTGLFLVFEQKKQNFTKAISQECKNFAKMSNFLLLVLYCRTIFSRRKPNLFEDETVTYRRRG
jgi:hypothetical protein